MTDESLSDTTQFVFMELVDSCLKALVNKTWTMEPPVVTKEMAMDPYVQTFLGALAHVKTAMVVTKDIGQQTDEVVDNGTQEDLRYFGVGQKNKPADLARLLRVGRMVTTEDWSRLKNDAISITAFLDKELPAERKDCKASFRQSFQKKLKEAKFKELEDMTPLIPAHLREQNLFVGFVYLPKDRDLMLQILQETMPDLEKCHEKKLQKEAKMAIKAEKVKEEPGAIKVKKEHLKKPKKEVVETIELWEL